MLISHGYSSNASIGGSSGTNIWALTAGNNFGVTTSGYLYSKNANINGTIVATSGKIGELIIGTSDEGLYYKDTNDWKTFIVKPNPNLLQYWELASKSADVFAQTLKIGMSLQLYNEAEAYSYHQVLLGYNGLLSSAGNKNDIGDWNGAIPLKYFSKIPFFSILPGTIPVTPKDNEPLINNKVHNPIICVTKETVNGGQTMTFNPPETYGITYNKLVYANAIGIGEDSGTIQTMAIEDSTTCKVWSTDTQKIYLFRIFI